MPDKPEVSIIAEALNIDPDAVIGKLIRFWLWCDQQSISGNALNVTKMFLDRLVHQPGFSDALIKADWLQVRSGSLEVPHFDRHNGQTAKARALANRRIAKHRATKAPKCNASSVTSPLQKALPEEEEEEEYKRSLSRARDPATQLPENHDEAVRFAGAQAIPPEFIRATFDRCAAVGWIDTQKRPIKSWSHYLAKSWRDEQQRAANTKTGKTADGPVPWQRNQHVVIEEREGF